MNRDTVITYGTNCFASHRAALRYYQSQSAGVIVTSEDIQAMVAAKETRIGAPNLKKGQRCRLNHGGRYLIEEKRRTGETA